MLEPKEGLLTFRAKGNNIRGTRHYSRVVHWPGVLSKCKGYGSGVTIGRGYDMKFRSRSRIISDLTFAGISLETAKKIAEAEKLHHCKAGEFVRDKNSGIVEITELQQLRLFELNYREYVVDSVRFYNKYKKSDSVSWNRLNEILKDVFVDMKYQGVLNSDMVPVFGLNNKKDVIKIISSSRYLMGFAPARGRIDYIKVGMK